jgi:7-cyano-7-deazaguanine synthase
VTSTPPGESHSDPSGTPPAVVLLSGGLDSATCLAVARRDGFEPVALSFSYGQRHSVELDAAATIAGANGVEHVVAFIDLRPFGGSALTDIAIDVPKHDRLDELDDAEIPVTYVPARNTIFLSFALALAEVRGATDIYIGVNALDYSGYPDCRPDYIEAYGQMANLATRAGVEHDGAGHRPLVIHTPLLHLHKSEIITLGARLGVDLASTISCYDPTPDGSACRRCDACLLRADGFDKAGIADPTPYVDSPAEHTADAELAGGAP